MVRTALFILVLMNAAGAYCMPAPESSRPVLINSSFDLTDLQKSILITRANKGDNDAASRLGLYFDFVTGHHSAAYFWFKKAATNGHVKSQFNLGVRSLGKKTFESCNEATYWFRLASKNGMLQAQKELDRGIDCSKLPRGAAPGQVP